MQTTNELLIIPNNIHNEFGFLFLFSVGIVIFYIIASILIQQQRVEKLKMAKKLIEEGHERKVYAERK